MILLKGIPVVQTSGDRNEAKVKQTVSVSNKGGTIEEASQKDNPWYKKAGYRIGNPVKDTAHSNPVTGEVWEFSVANAEGTISGAYALTEGLRIKE